MRMRPYSDRAALAFAYEQTIDHFGMWVLVVLVEFVTLFMRLGALVLLVGMAGKSFFGTSLNYPLLQSTLFDFSSFQASFTVIMTVLAFCLVFELIGGIFDMGIMRIRLDLFETQKSSFSRILSCPQLAFKHFIATIFYWTAVLVGLVFFIIPGLILAIRLGFYRSILVETGCGPVTALKESARITCGSMSSLITTGVLRLLLVLPFLRGDIVLFTDFLIFPFLGLAAIPVYKALLGRAGGEAQQ